MQDGWPLGRYVFDCENKLVIILGEATGFSYILSLDGIEVRVLDLIPLILAFSRKGRRIG